MQWKSPSHKSLVICRRRRMFLMQRASRWPTKAIQGMFSWQFLVNICFSSPKGNYISSSTLQRFLHPGEQPTHCNFHLPTFGTTPWQRPRFNGRILYSYKNREFLFVSSQNFTWNHSFRLLSCPTCVETPWRRFLNKQTIQGKKNRKQKQQRLWTL